MPMLGFETLTFCPIDRTIVIPELLTHDECIGSTTITPAPARR